ncbi:SPOR domain-containing protein [Actibacterium pelagium]|uniref:Sporulation protein n=1 Tax=Actibacterium pelagium TaxID=2029103 RepID=A0A917ABR2_9RHOB|nr:SPOR domain-containing protein [Actibacterium pelagium]GGE40966.1 sporulation protein [Actibacterium pelagium]
MADIDFDDFADTSPSYSEGPKISNAVNWVGALVSLGLVGGVAFWGYDLMMRDVHGVPVVRALEGPMRVAPEDPGGRLAEHMGLAVNQVASEGEAAAPAERLVLAPRPVTLTESDKPLSNLRPAARIVPNTPVEQTPVEAATQNAITAPPPVTSGAEPITAPEPVLAATEPEEPVAPKPAVLTTPSGVEILPASVPGPSRSIRPSGRPAPSRFASATAAALAEAMAAPAAPAPTEVASVAAGAHLVQLGAFDSEAIARSEWDRLSGRFGSFLEGKQRLIQQAERGGRTFYRLRAVGFADLSDTRRFCAALTAEGAGCVPVTAK